MEKLYDINKNYYNILGVDRTATSEELKAAHVKLALLYHPDTQNRTSSQTKNDKIKFHDVSEAWSVLSRPDVRKSYDIERQYMTNNQNHQSYQSSSSYSQSTDTDHYDQHISSSFAPSRDNYTINVRKNASSNWRDTVDKYKSEKWQKMNLKDKKGFRARPVTSAGSLGLGFLVVGLSVAAISTWTYRYIQQSNNQKFSNNKRY